MIINQTVRGAYSITNEKEIFQYVEGGIWKYE
jgi:hypothetical protein